MRSARFDIDLIAGQAGGKAGVLPFFADGKGELVCRDIYQGVALLADLDGIDNGGGEGACDEFLGILAVFDDIDAFAAEFIHNAGNTHAVVSDAGADRINIFIRGAHGDLGAAAGFAGNVFDYHGAVCNCGPP